MRFRKLLPPLAFAGLVALLLAVVDRVAMDRFYPEERAFLRDVDHRPPTDHPEINEHGLRETRSADAFPESDFNLIFLGDSFVYGFHVRPEESIPQRVERALRAAYPERRINVANFGWVSASPLLSLRQLEDIGSLYHPDLVVLCIDMTDFHDDIKYEKYLEKPGLFALLHVLPAFFFALKDVAKARGWHEALFGYPSDRFFAVNRPLEESRKYLEPFQRNVDAIADYATTTLGARFALIVFPRTFQYSDRESPQSWERNQYTPLGPYVLEPFRYFEELDGRRPYPIGSLLETFQRTEVFPTAFLADPHWNKHGTRIAAQAIVDFLEAKGLLE